MRRLAALWILLALIAVPALTLPEASAQFAGPAPSPGQETIAEPGWLDAVTSWIRVRQQSYYRELGAAVKTLKSDFSGAAAATLIAIAFVYGVFHAAGPGHGKAVISAYMLANERSVRRGIILSGLAAFAQAVTAIAAVYGFVLVLGFTGRSAQGFALDLEVASYAMITALGAWLLWRAASPLLAGHGGHAGHGHRHHSESHTHVPDPVLADRPLTVANAAPIVAGIGLRPCSGAIVVLIFAHTLGLYLAGVAATLAMAVGTAITVAALATLAVGSRDLAARMIGLRSRWLGPFYRLVTIAGALAVLILGALLLHASLTAPARPFI